MQAGSINTGFALLGVPLFGGFARLLHLHHAQLRDKIVPSISFGGEASRTQEYGAHENQHAEGACHNHDQ
jgi:hypothetical protein